MSKEKICPLMTRAGTGKMIFCSKMCAWYSEDYRGCIMKKVKIKNE